MLSFLELKAGPAISLMADGIVHNVIYKVGSSTHLYVPETSREKGCFGRAPGQMIVMQSERGS